MAPQGFVYNQKFWTEIDFDAVEMLKKIAADHGKSLPQFALAWVLHKKGITSIVAGTSSLEQFDQNFGAIGIKLTQEELDACDEVWNYLRPPRLFYGR